MDERLRRRFPKWCSETSEDTSLIIGDDIDSVMTTMLLKKIHNYDINYFFDFENMYEGKYACIFEDKIGCDMALVDGKTWDNHVTMPTKSSYRNVDSANVNNFYRINRKNYIQKYAGSTLLIVYSYYNIPLPDTDEGKKILLAVDSAYLGHYKDRYKTVHNKWLKLLGFEELIEFLDKTPEEEFRRVIEQYGLHKKVGLHNGILSTEIDLEGIQRFFDFNLTLPTWEYIIEEPFNRRNVNLKPYDRKGKTIGVGEKTFSFALTYKNNASYSARKKIPIGDE